MEYLMTYGWAILIIAVVLGALFQLGVFNSSSFSPRAPPGACHVFRPSGPGTTTNINLMGVCTGQLPQYVAQFNGQTSSVSIPDSSSLAITGTITVSAWAFFTSYRVNGMVFNRDTAGNVGGYILASETANTSSSITFKNFVYTSAWVSTSSITVPMNMWEFIAFTYNGTKIVSYVNGIAVSSTTASGAINNPGSALDLIGKWAGSSLYYFPGSISNIQIYNTSLSANQVQALYVEGIGGAPMKLQNLVGWWPMNGDVNDYSGNNNNGVPTAVTFTSQYGK